MIRITTDQKDPAKIREEVENEIESFSTWYSSRFKTQPLSGFEKLMLKTYLTARLAEGLREEEKPAG